MKWIANTSGWWFLLKSILFYISLVGLALLLNLEVEFGESFRKRGNNSFENRIENTKVEFIKQEKSAFDTKIRVFFSKDLQSAYVDFLMDSWYLAFIPKAIFLSLLLATRYHSLLRKLLALITGFLLTHIFIFFVLYIRVWILRIEARNILGLSDYNLWDKLMIFFHNNIAVYSWIGFVLPVFAWALVYILNLVPQRTRI
jgi:hypothetical protein